MRNFRTLEIWNLAIDIVKEVYRLCERFPKKEQYVLIGQMTRAAVSAPSNIAEGCSRNSDKEYTRFLEIAIGSLFELETQLIIAKELRYVSVEDYTLILAKITKCQKMINSLIRKIGL